MDPRICIIGAGISGITTGKFLKEKGLGYVCFEMSDRIGGNWAFKNPNGRSSAYRSLHIDTSRERLQFDDFPMPAHYPTFCHHSQILQYFTDVVDHFGLREHIRFNTEVKRARREGREWIIELANGETHTFDYLIVANGHHWDPHVPEFPGHFGGISLHSHAYIDPFEPLDMRGKNILVVGIGNSAVDIASELSNRSLASRLFLSTRRGAYVVPKYIFGKPVDQVVETLPYVPLKWQRRAGALLLRLIVGRMERYGLPTPDHKLLEAHPTVSSDLLQRVGSGDILVKPNIETLDGDSVRFADGSTEKVDVIIYATGYNIRFPFFEPDFISASNNEIPLFKRIFIPEIPNLMFVGFAQAIPSIIKFVQDQARFIAAYLAGEYALPAVPEMQQAIIRDEAAHRKHYVSSRRHTMQVDHNLYKWDLAKELKRGRKRAAQANHHLHCEA